MDPAWLNIIRNHPEIELDSSGRPIKLERNHNLRHTVAIQSHLQTSGCVASLETSQGLLIASTLDNALIVSNPATGTQLTSFSLRVTNPALPYGVPPSQLLPGSFSTIKASHSFYTAPSDENQSMLFLQQRVVLLTLDLFVETFTPDVIAAAVKKAAQAKKDAGPSELKPRTFMRYRAMVFDIFANDIQVAHIDKIHDWYFLEPVIEFDHLKQQHDEAHRRLGMSLSDDGRLLSIIIHDQPAAVCQVYDLSAPFLQRDPPSDPSESSNAVVLLAPALVTQWKVNAQPTQTEINLQNEEADLAVDCIVKSLIFISPIPGVSSSANEAAPAAVSAVAATPAPTTVALRPQVYAQTKILIILSHTPFIPLLQLQLKPPEPANAKAPPAPKPGKNGELPPPVVTWSCVVSEIKRMNLTTTSTVISLPGKGLMVVGQEDGVISLFDVNKAMLIAVLGQHRSAITSILSSKETASGGGLIVVAGAMDGSLTMYSNTQTAQPDRLSMYPPSLIDYRHDCLDDPVLMLTSMPAGTTTDMKLILARHASSKVAIYGLDLLPSVQLVGSLTTHCRVDFREVKSILLSTANLPVSQYHPAEDVLNPPLPVEAIPPPKGAAAGKGKEAVAVVEEPVIEEVREEAAIEVINPLSFVTQRSWVRKECEDILLRRGLSLSTLVRGSYAVDNKRGELWQAAVRDEQSAVLCFKVREQALKLIQSSTAAMAAEEEDMSGGVDMLMPLPPTSRQLKKNGSNKTLLKSGSTTINKLRNNVLNNSSSNVDVMAPSYRNLKLTEERLHAHEQAYALSSNHSGSNKQNNGGVILQPIDATTEMKSELWRQKKLRGQQKMTITKKLTALAALCT